MPKQTLTPIHVLHNLIDMFTQPGVPEVERIAAVELNLMFVLDPSAETDLLRALFAGQQINITTRTGLQRMLDILNAYGAVEQQFDPSNPEKFGLKFHAQPLINLLKRQPHRDPHNGLSPKIVQLHCGNN